MLDQNQLLDLAYLNKYIKKISQTEDLEERIGLKEDLEYIFDRLLASL